MNKTLGYLGLARNAGKLEIGEDGTCGAIRSRKAKAVFLAQDAAENSRRRAGTLASANRVPCFTVTVSKAELGAALGRDLCAMLAVCDAGLALAAAKTLVSEHAPYTEEMALLTQSSKS